MTISEDQRLEMAAGRGALRVRISGVENEDLPKLLEDSARFLRDHPSYIVKGEKNEFLLKRDDVGDFVIIGVDY